MNAETKKRRLMRRYDQSARVYDSQYREEQEAKIRAATDKVTVTSKSVVLDVGCGTGLLFEHVTNNAQFIVGTDISRRLLSEASRRTQTCQNATLVHSDSDNLPFRNRTFDFVFAITVVQNIPRPEVTLNEIRRVSKPNAKIIVTGLKKSFTEKEFIHTLEQAHLRIKSMKTDYGLKDYVCICLKTAVKSKLCT